MQGDSTGGSGSPAKPSVLEVAIFELRVLPEISDRFVDLTQHALLVLTQDTFQHHVVGNMITAKYRVFEFTGRNQGLHFLAQLDGVEIVKIIIEAGDKLFPSLVKSQHQRRQVIRLGVVNQSRRRERVLLAEPLAADPIQYHYRRLDTGATGAPQRIDRAGVGFALVDVAQHGVVAAFGNTVSSPLSAPT